MFVLFIVAVAVFLIFAGAFLNSFLSNLGINPNAGSDGDVFANCAFLSDEEAKAVFGGNADAIELSNFADLTIGLIIDKRVLASSPDCWVDQGDKAYIARIALHQGADASAVFAAERKAAEPTSEDQGGGVTLENEGYFGGEVSGVGDEAFCTGIHQAIMAGVLVRQGDRVVYVSVGPANENEPPAMGTEGDVITAPELCTFAQEVAREVLR